MDSQGAVMDRKTVGEYFWFEVSQKLFYTDRSSHVQRTNSRKYPYSPCKRDWKFLGVGGSQRPKNLSKCMKLDWNFQRGGGYKEKSLPWGRYK